MAFLVLTQSEVEQLLDMEGCMGAMEEIPLRNAALVAAVREVAGALVARGIFP